MTYNMLSETLNPMMSIYLSHSTARTLYIYDKHRALPSHLHRVAACISDQSFRNDMPYTPTRYITASVLMGSSSSFYFSSTLKLEMFCWLVCCCMHYNT